MKYLAIIGCDKSTQEKKNIACVIGQTLQQHGFHSTYLKIDPHLNYNVGRVEPGENGEVYVLRDGGEVDLDLGVYERLCDVILTNDNYLTLGQVLYDAIKKEKQGCYDTKILSFEEIFSMALLEHVEDLSKSQVLCTRTNRYIQPDFMILDFGSDVVAPEMVFYIKSICRMISSLPASDISIMLVDSDFNTVDKNFTNYLVDQFRKFEVKNDVLVLHTRTVGDSVETLWKAKHENGSSSILYESSTNKDVVDRDSVFDNKSFSIFVKYLGQEISEIQPFALTRKEFSKVKSVGIVTRYKKQANPYASVEEALIAAGQRANVLVDIVYINYMDIEEGGSEAYSMLERVDGILIPGGFGSHGVEAKISVAKYARCNKKPFLGICLGYQIGIIEFARNVLNIKSATSQEFDSHAQHPVVKKLPRVVCRNTGEDIYLGEYAVEYRQDINDIYPARLMMQRFRHRYGLNINYKTEMEDKGLSFTAKNANDVVVMFRLREHPFYVGVQYHPELGSTPCNIDPVFLSFVNSL